MRYILTLFLAFHLSSTAQDSTRKDYPSIPFRSTEHIWGLWTNFQQGRYPELAVGVAYSINDYSRCAFGNGGSTISLAYQRALMGDMVEQGISLSYYIHSFIPVSLGLQIGYKNRDQHHFIQTKPMIGFEVGRLLVAYSYSIHFYKKESYDGIPLSTHQFQLAFQLPLIRSTD